MSAVTELQLSKNPSLQALVGDIGKQFQGAMAQIQSGAQEARTMVSQAPDRGEGLTR